MPETLLPSGTKKAGPTTPCKLDGFRGGLPTPQTAMWTDRVVVSPPAFRQGLCFLECVEQLAVEKLRPHMSIE
jgi:hypothetical protein